MAATVAASEARRVEETRELAAQTAAEWIAGQPDAKLVREAGAIKCGKKGTIDILELQKEYRQELAKLTDGKVLAECCAPLRRAASKVLDDGGCVVLRGFPLHEDASVAWRCLAISEALGETLPQLPDGEGLPRRMVSSSPLGNEHPSPASSKIARILIACARPPKNKQSLKVATAECLLRGTSLEARGTLRRNCAYACEQFHDKWGGSKEGKAPLCGQDANYRKTLKYSAQLKVNVDWCEEAEEAAIDACSELEKAATDASFPFDLRQGDVLVFDALRWLFSYEAAADDHDGLCWGPNGWMPLRALPPDQRKGARIEPYLLKTWLGRREFGDVVSTADIEDDAAWLASLADQTAGVAVQ
jgi:hypothetical protein